MTLTSWWHQQHPAAAVTASTGATTAPRNGRYDVVVVGAGITGLTTALLLARSGRSVLVLEARHVGAGTTGSSTAKVSLLQGTRLSQIRRLHPLSTVRDYVTANSEGLAWFARFCEDSGVRLERRTAWTYATSAAGERSVRKEHDVALEAGLPVEWVDAPVLPFHTTGAVRLDDQAQVDPMAFLAALATETVGHGAEIVEGTRVEHVRGSGPVRVTTSAGEVSADTVVVATNLPMLDRGAFFARMEPARSYALAYRTPTQAVDGMYLSADQPSRSLRDVAGPEGPLLLVGGAGHTTGRRTPTSASLAELRVWTAEHFPRAEEVAAWSAQDYVPAHSLPFAGPLLPGRSDVLFAGGYAKWGMTNGVAAALALAAHVTGESPAWAHALASWAPQEVRGGLTHARMNTQVGLELAKGWLRPVLGSDPEEGEAAVLARPFAPPVAVSRVDAVERTVSAVCTHLGGVVRWNDAERSWDCPLHGSRFDVDGEPLEGPAVCGLRNR